MNQIKRIVEMEQIFDETLQTLNQFEDALVKYKELQAKIQTLNAYYTSTLWRQDYEDDAEGKLPSQLKRGILSEDGICNMLSQNKVILDELKELVK